MFARNPNVARTHRERTEATRQALAEAARTLFVSRGYAETSTPDVCAAAGITRGALYHHFADKRDLFRHVLAREAAAVAADIEAATPPGQDPAEALLSGAQAYLQAMTVPGRTRLLLVDGPAVLGLREMLALDEAHAARTLREGLEAAGVAANGVAPMLSAAFDRAALEIEAGADAGSVREAMLWLLRRVLGQAGG
ncbi:TetR/AcrR family transcriptional regulator [Cupriavidus neocaledonicus]|uniref:transcriptional regulator, TetR family n=1 Tax=Cupriavidus neocaledonicus TaxID=1040979 RepID=A0A375H4U4_9BURK|nr:TetR/AcrR family transcriptional regulator [Cupriavidus neocaledonicus]SOZ36593.1 putative TRANSCRIPTIONal REGULATOR, TetR family [Cupriavidus neocaledonicus]SPD45249.1 Transcriptional regulator, TetR family [Cupriavidus neocaledonicus]